MRKILLAMSILCYLSGQSQEDFVIRLNDTLINIELDKGYIIDVNGNKLKFSLKLKDTLTYTNTFYIFLYPKAFKVSNTTIDVGIDQASILTAEGSGILIQKYETLNPTSLNEIMLQELTKESISYGFESKRSTYKRKLKSGQEIEVTKAVLSYKDEVNVYEVASIGKKDAGLVIVTMKMDEQTATQGQKVIDLMWQSLTVK